MSLVGMFGEPGPPAHAHQPAAFMEEEEGGKGIKLEEDRKLRKLVWQDDEEILFLISQWVSQH